MEERPGLIAAGNMSIPVASCTMAATTTTTMMILCMEPCPPTTLLVRSMHCLDGKEMESLPEKRNLGENEKKI